MSIKLADMRLCSMCARRVPLRSSATSIPRREYSYSSRGKYRKPSHHIDKFYEGKLTAPSPLACAHVCSPDLLSQKSPAPQTRTPPAPPPKEALPKTDREETLQKARVVFGSRLAGPADRRRDLEAASKRIAGVLVPPRPEEPDNCCMSGCVNCVWDRYRDELEDWAEKRTEADRRLAQQGHAEAGTRERRRPAGLSGQSVPAHVAHSMDDDGGGSESNWDLGPPSGTVSSAPRDLFADIPVGIREFMRTEKKLKQSKQAKRAAAIA